MRKAPRSRAQKYIRQSMSAVDFGFPTVHRAGATPVPIPNTEVKPCFGDGTAGIPGGRVARRWDLLGRRRSIDRRRLLVWALESRPAAVQADLKDCLLYTSDAADERS